MVDLTKKEIFEEIKKQAQDVIIENDIRRANNFIRSIDKLLKLPENKNLVNFPSIQKEYEKIVSSLSFICLASLTDKEIVSLFENDLYSGLENEYIDLIDKTKTKLVSIASFDERDVLRRKIREALMRNNQKIGNIRLQMEEKSVISSVANWLKKYSSQVGPSPVNAAISNQFFSTDKDFAKLSGNDPALLRKLINLFEFLKESSKTPEGLEDPVAFRVNDEIKILNKGKFEDIKLPSNAERVIKDLFPDFGKKTNESEAIGLSNLESEVKIAYQGDLKQQKNIEFQIEKLKKTAGNDPAKLQAEFYKSVQNQDLNATVAAIKLLAINNQLLDFIKKDQKLNKFLMATWLKLYGQKIADDFVKNPIEPKFIRMFLKYVLVDRLKMNNSDAGRIALQIANILVSQGKLEYNRMAYFDVSGKDFKWFED